MTRQCLTSLACLLVAGAAGAAEVVTVTLVGGGRITAPMLRQNDDGVALDLGFSSQSHFTRLFSGLTGITPRQYQRLHARMCP